MAEELHALYRCGNLAGDQNAKTSL
jgi:hypothetical protein